MKGKTQLTKSSRSRLHFIGALIQSPSLSCRLALRNPANMTWREEGDSRRVDLLEDRTTHGMRHSNLSRAGTLNIHPCDWSGVADEGSLGRQQFQI